ncbi:VanW family protein [Candidatus Shapirobacteria bacterium]|nr:VanW family protein [Candidatus Shapirobacteria bacterium]
MKQKSIITILFIVVLFSPLAAIFAFQLAYRNKIYPGIKAGNWELGKLTLAQAENLLTQTAQESAYQLNLTYQDKTFTFDLDQLSLKFYPQKTADQAYYWGRSQSWSQNTAEQYQAFTRGKRLPLSFSFDESLFKTNLASISAQINQPQIPTGLILEKGKIQVKAGQLGLQIDTPGLSAQINQILANGNWQDSLEIPVITTGWLPNEEQIAATAAQAQKLIGKSVILSGPEQNFILKEEQLVEFLDFNGGWQKEKINTWLNSLAKGLEKKPQNALFKFENNRVTEFSPEIQGISLDQEQAISLILRTLSAFLNNGQTRAILELPVEQIDPETRIADANQLGITGLVAKGESWFHHSIASRIHNVKTGSTRLNGILIKPGEEFSFNQAIGEISQKTGYQQAWIIEGGRTVLGDGGGVCQISTTLFRTALNAGLPILERHAHAYRVSYYEINSELGIDATVFSPSVDLKFKNDYPCHLLIQIEFDPVSKYLSFSLYGCPDGRVSTLNNFKTWGIVPPPPPSYTDDPALPSGVTKQIDFAAWGAKASFDWKVERNGETLSEQTFYSSYRPWQAVYLKGTALL